MSDLTTHLLRSAEAYCRRTGLSKARLATIVINDGKFFDRVAAGGGLTVKTYEKFMAHFEADAEKPAIDGGKAA
ncbi:MAG TPA: hypothetical protein VHQ39_06830 [Dongiaceae bacterium]|nr:hypothetical protein [Dongiaceae bacterium]